MDAAYVFGKLGNLTSALGYGWSVEDDFAWGIGEESDFALPLPGDDNTYLLRFDIHPLIITGVTERQRLIIKAGQTELGAFELVARETVVLTLPPDITTGVTTVKLTFLHPDAVRPSDHLPIDDRRRLSVCFHSVSVSQAGADDRAGGGSVLEPVHGLIAGDATALRIAEIITKLPSLKGRFGVRFLDLSRSLGDEAVRLPAGAVDGAQFCWLEGNAGTPASRENLRASVPERCTTRDFYTPTCQAFWPFLTQDYRAVPEPGRYHPSRYPFGDRIALAFSTMNMPDDVVYLMYDMAANEDPVDLEAMFAEDLRRWRAYDKKTSVLLADFIERRISSHRMFLSPNRIGPELVREMTEQILDDAIVRDIVRPEILSAELDNLLIGHFGWQEEIPISKRVARHFELAWWSPDMVYRWMNNKRTERQYILDYIRWVQWRP